MEGDIVLAHEFDVADVMGALVGPPPAFPVLALGVGPLAGGGDVFDGGVEPDVEDLVLEARPGLPAAGHRHAPGQVAGDAAVDQALVEVLVADGPGQMRPVRLAVEPGPDLALQLRLQQVEVAGLADLEVGGARYGRIGFDEIRRIQQPTAVVALVAPRGTIAAVWTRALDVTVRQEPLVFDRVDHPVDPLFDQAIILQDVGEVLGEQAVLR